MRCELLGIEEPKDSNRTGAKLRVHFDSSAGRSLRTSVNIDLVVGCNVTGTIDEEPVEALEAVFQEKMPSVKLYPIVDHLADKVAATMQIYPHHANSTESTRVKDLVDIAHIAFTEIIDGHELTVALESE